MNHRLDEVGPTLGDDRPAGIRRAWFAYDGCYGGYLAPLVAFDVCHDDAGGQVSQHAAEALFRGGGYGYVFVAHLTDLGGYPVNDLLHVEADQADLLGNHQTNDRGSQAI